MDALRESKTNLQTKFPKCEVQTHLANFSTQMNTESAYKQFFTPILDKIDVAIIAPCAGVCSAGYFSDMDS